MRQITTKRAVGKAAPQTDPAASMTPAEAEALAGLVVLDGIDSARLSRLCLLLRWLAFNDDGAAREALSITAEAKAAPYIVGVDDAINEQMRAQLAALREGGAR
jgi:hypothetical protein